MERNLCLNWPALVEEAIKQRKNQKITQKKLAVLAGVSVLTVGRFEQGNTTLSVQNALKILETLGLIQIGPTTQSDFTYLAEKWNQLPKLALLWIHNQAGSTVSQNHFFTYFPNIIKLQPQLSPEELADTNSPDALDHLLKSLEDEKLIARHSKNSNTLFITQKGIEFLVFIKLLRRFGGTKR